MVLQESDARPGDMSSCPLCLKKGKINKLKLFQINLQEAFLSCENVECLYPAGIELGETSLLVQRQCLEMLNDGQQDINCIATDEGSASKSEEDALVNEIEQLVDGSFATDCLDPDFECGFEEILEFLGSAPNSQTHSGQNSDQFNTSGNETK